MPSRVKLLNAAAGGTTGTSFKIGMGQPPYVIRCAGTYTVPGGTAGTLGVNIETSPDDGTTWTRDIGITGGENITEGATTVQELVDLPTKTIAIIQHYTKHIRATTGANMTGNATVYLEMGR